MRSPAQQVCKNPPMDWDDLRYFLELARTRRLARAGRKLGVDHTTVGRRIELLERSLGCRLFEAGSEGYALTDAGRRLLEHAESIENSVDLMQTEARGEGVRVGGTVRIGAPEGFAAVFLVPRLTRLFEAHPELHVELLTLPRFPSLAAREADILVTLDPPADRPLHRCAARGLHVWAVCVQVVPPPARSDPDAGRPAAPPDGGLHRRAAARAHGCDFIERTVAGARGSG